MSEVTVTIQTDQTPAEIEVMRVAALCANTQPQWSAQLQFIVKELQRYRAIFNQSTVIQGDDDVIKYVTSGNAIPVTRCTVSADLIRSLIEKAKP